LKVKHFSSLHWQLQPFQPAAETAAVESKQTAATSPAMQLLLQPLHLGQLAPIKRMLAPT
jgi:hypothetical protein